MQYADFFFFLKQIYSSSEALNCTTAEHFCGTNFQGPGKSGFLTDLAAFKKKKKEIFLALVHVVAALAGLM